MGENRHPAGRRGSLLHTVKAIGWGFFGVRSGRAHELDRVHLNPVHVIIAGIVLAGVMVVVLVLIANWAVG